MPNPLREWRRTRRETGYWKKARDRSVSMREAEIVDHLDLTIMTMGQAVTRYRQAGNRDGQLDQLLELRMQLEAMLGMMENLIPE